MNHANKIDKVLEYVVSHPDVRLTREKVQEGLKYDSTKELVEILNKLAVDGFALKQVRNNVATYLSTFDGRIFYEKGGYKAHFKSDRRKSWKDKFLSWLYIVNIVAIIILTYLNYKATDKANNHKEEIMELDGRIEILQSINDSLQTNLNTLINQNKDKNAVIK